MKKVWLWWSSGKDSAWAFDVLRRDPEVIIDRLVTTVTPKFDRVAIHGTRLSLLDEQARALGVSVEKVELPYPCTNADYEARARAILEKALVASVDQMAFGDLFLEDVREYRENLLKGVPIEPIFPVWGRETDGLAKEMIKSGLIARVTCLNPDLMDANLAGAAFDLKFLNRLPHGVDPCGENGEFHTCVTGGPNFEGDIPVHLGETVIRDGFVFADIVPESDAVLPQIP